jgi:hypothetical protein
VRIEQTFPVVVTPNRSSKINTFSPAEIVKDAWLEYHWKKGGGLPIFVMPTRNSSNSNIDQKKKRMILPIMMEETIEVEENTGDGKKDDNVDSCQIQYKITKPGPFLQADLIPNSHLGTVNFITTQSTHEIQECKMIWDVSFETKRFKQFYEAFTEFTIGTASRTVSDSVAPLRLLTLQTTLTIPNSSMNPMIEAQNAWLEFCWKNGGGLPVLPAIPFGDIIVDGERRSIVGARKNLLRIPPLLIESIFDISATDEYSEIMYQISNPGWMSFPFLVVTHMGRVRFLKPKRTPPVDDDVSTIDVVWEVEIRPYQLVGSVVEKWVEMTVSTMMRNMQVHLAEPGAKVDIKAPRGKRISDTLENFGSVPKDTWLGGVLYAHLSDKRSTLEQTQSLFQPWTWGRSGSGNNDDIVRFQWSTCQIN